MDQIIALNPDYAPEDSAAALGLINGTTSLTKGVLNKRETYSCYGLEAALTSVIDVSLLLRPVFVAEVLLLTAYYRL
jgi:hypothetical protein